MSYSNSQSPPAKSFTYENSRNSGYAAVTVPGSANPVPLSASSTPVAVNITKGVPLANTAPAASSIWNLPANANDDVYDGDTGDITFSASVTASPRQPHPQHSAQSPRVGGVAATVSPRTVTPLSPRTTKEAGVAPTSPRTHPAAPTAVSPRAALPSSPRGEGGADHSRYESFCLSRSILVLMSRCSLSPVARPDNLPDLPPLTKQKFTSLELDIMLRHIKHQLQICVLSSKVLRSTSIL